MKTLKFYRKINSSLQFNQKLVPNNFNIVLISDNFENEKITKIKNKQFVYQDIFTKNIKLKNYIYGISGFLSVSYLNFQDLENPIKKNIFKNLKFMIYKNTIFTKNRFNFFILNKTNLYFKSKIAQFLLDFLFLNNSILNLNKNLIYYIRNVK